MVTWTPSAETRKKWSEQRKGRIPWNKGIIYTNRMKKKIIETNQKRVGSFHSEETKRKMSEAHKGLVKTWEHRRNLSISHAGKGHTKETIEKMKRSLKGRIPWNKGKKWPENVRQKMSESAKKRVASEETRKILSECHRGEKAGRAWKGGIAHLPYATNWTETLKRSIRERDHYICQLCSKQQGDIALAVHHIDYDKENCNPGNLISLCQHPCHMKTNQDRDYWKKHFTDLMVIKNAGN